MEHNLEHTISLLTRTPATLNALLRDLPEAWTLRNEGENSRGEKSWSTFDVIGHLIHAERTDWMPRARMVLQFGESQPFESFDRWGHVSESQGKSLGQLLDEFARLRAHSLDELRALNLRPEYLERRGRHPALELVTLSQLLATCAAHDLFICTKSQGSWPTNTARLWVRGAHTLACCNAPATALNELFRQDGWPAATQLRSPRHVR